MLPRIVEALSAIRVGTDNHKLVTHDTLQVFIPGVAAGIQVDYTIAPRGYATIHYRWVPDAAMVPNAWTVTQIQGGVHWLNQLADASLLRDGAHQLIINTVRDPILMTITNVSAAVQFWRETYYFLVVSSADDYKTVQEYMNRLGGVV